MPPKKTSIRSSKKTPIRSSKKTSIRSSKKTQTKSPRISIGRVLPAMPSRVAPTLVGELQKRDEEIKKQKQTIQNVVSDVFAISHKYELMKQTANKCIIEKNQKEKELKNLEDQMQKVVSQSMKQCQDEELKREIRELDNKYQRELKKKDMALANGIEHAISVSNRYLSEGIQKTKQLKNLEEQIQNREQELENTRVQLKKALDEAASSSGMKQVLDKMQLQKEKMQNHIKTRADRIKELEKLNKELSDQLYQVTSRLEELQTNVRDLSFEYGNESEKYQSQIKQLNKDLETAMSSVFSLEAKQSNLEGIFDQCLVSEDGAKRCIERIKHQYPNICALGVCDGQVISITKETPNGKVIQAVNPIPIAPPLEAIAKENPDMPSMVKEIPVCESGFKYNRGLGQCMPDKSGGLGGLGGISLKKESLPRSSSAPDLSSILGGPRKQFKKVEPVTKKEIAQQEDKLRAFLGGRRSQMTEDEEDW